eukprot:jgi/Chlat1/224/Chrsp1S03131
MSSSSDRCMKTVMRGAALGAGIGGAIGVMYGSFEAFRYKVPGLFKLRYIGQQTLGTAAAFSVLLGAGSIIRCGRHD